MICPECKTKRRNLIECELCFLVCCYKCAVRKRKGKLLLAACERFGDRWPELPPDPKQTKPHGEMGADSQTRLNRGPHWAAMKLVAVNPRDPMLHSTNVSPGGGHRWGPARLDPV